MLLNQEAERLSDNHGQGSGEDETGEFGQARPRPSDSQESCQACQKTRYHQVSTAAGMDRQLGLASLETCQTLSCGVSERFSIHPSIDIEAVESGAGHGVQVRLSPGQDVHCRVLERVVSPQSSYEGHV